MKKLLLSSIAAFTLCAGIAHAAPVIGEAAPNFSEKDTSGKERTLAEFKGKLVVLEWKNHECPFVKKSW